MRPVEIKDKVFWVGAVDWNIRDFHGYSTERGTSYNAFLIRDEKTVLFDTVKRPFLSDLIANIKALVEPSKIDYIIINHVEMDHSGCLPEIVELVQPKKIFCSPKGREALLQHFHHPEWPYEAVSSGQSLSLGKRSVTFLETRMLHWPDSMFSYIKEENLLISSDAFGQHWATSERFDDQVDLHQLMKQAAKYYGNILLPFSPLVQKLLAQVTEMNLKIDMIACDHGLIWRTHPEKIIAAYDAWSKQVPAKKALVIYDTMWHSTEAMARAIADGIMAEEAGVKLFNLRFSHRSDILTEVMDAGALVLGSATINNGVLPRMADFLAYLRGLRPAKKIAAAFGSYGWSGEAVKLINESLEEMKMEVVSKGVRAQYVPDDAALIQCFELGREMGKKMNNGPLAHIR